MSVLTPEQEARVREIVDAVAAEKAAARAAVITRHREENCARLAAECKELDAARAAVARVTGAADA